MSKMINSFEEKTGISFSDVKRSKEFKGIAKWREAEVSDSLNLKLLYVQGYHEGELQFYTRKEYKSKSMDKLSKIPTVKLFFVDADTESPTKYFTAYVKEWKPAKNKKALAVKAEEKPVTAPVKKGIVNTVFSKRNAVKPEKMIQLPNGQMVTESEARAEAEKMKAWLKSINA